MWKYTLQSPSFIIDITGGTVRITDKHTGKVIKEHKGYTYLYTGAIHPDETEFFALENGKHFYVYSLKNFELIKRVTLPRTYMSIDVYGHYSDDGKTIIIPAERYVYDDTEAELGHYEFVLFKYRTEDYTLIETLQIENQDEYRWNIE